MKLILPLEHRIQAKGMEYDDEELMRDAMEVHSLRKDLDSHRKANQGLAAALGAALVILTAIVIYRLVPWL